MVACRLTPSVRLIPKLNLTPIQVFVPPVSPTRDRHHLAHLRLWEEFRTTFVKPPNVEEGRICSPKLEVDRMPSTIERSQSPNSTARSVTKKVNVAPKDDEERLLYGLRYGMHLLFNLCWCLLNYFRRSDDAAAVPIARPTTRPMNRPQGKVRFILYG